MFNLIKMDLHRMVHSVSTWVIIILTVVLAVFTVAMTKTAQNIIEDMQYEELIQNTAPDNSSSDIGIYIETDPMWLNGDIDAGEIVGAEINSCLLALLCVIFTAVFVNAEQKNGYIKNIAGQYPNRGVLVISKLAAIALQVLLMIIIFSVVVAVSGFAFWGNSFHFGSVSGLIQMLAIQYLLHLGMCSCVLLLCVLTRSSVFGMLMGILASGGVFMTFYSLINSAVCALFPNCNFDINLFMLESNISAVGIGAGQNTMIRAVLVGCVFTLFTTAGAMIVMKKRDVR